MSVPSKDWAIFDLSSEHERHNPKIPDFCSRFAEDCDFAVLILSIVCVVFAWKYGNHCGQ